MMSRRVLVGAGAVAAAGAGAALASSGRERVTAVDVHPKDYPTVEAVRWIGDEVARET